MDYGQDLIGQAWKLLDDERLLQQLTLGEWELRIGHAHHDVLARARKMQQDCLLTTLAARAKALGKRVILSLEDAEGDIL